MVICLLDAGAADAAVFASGGFGEVAGSAGGGGGGGMEDGVVVGVDKHCGTVVERGYG